MSGVIQSCRGDKPRSLGCVLGAARARRWERPRGESPWSRARVPPEPVARGDPLGPVARGDPLGPLPPGRTGGEAALRSSALQK